MKHVKLIWVPKQGTQICHFSCPINPLMPAWFLRV